MNTPVGIAILAGGKSSRMGRDKANLRSTDHTGTTLLERIVALAYAVSGSPVLIAGRSQPENWRRGPAETLFLPDDVADAGPIGGLLTVLKHAGGKATMVVACDMPSLSQESMEWLLHQPIGRYGTITRNHDQLEPLFALYTPECLTLVETVLQRGKRSLHALIQSGQAGFQVADAPPDVCNTLVNVNTPDEWQAWVNRLPSP